MTMALALCHELSMTMALALCHKLSMTMALALCHKLSMTAYVDAVETCLMYCQGFGLRVY